MPKQVKKAPEPKKRPRGRPEERPSTLTRMAIEDIAALDAWIARQPEPMSRVEALRRAVAALIAPRTVATHNP